MLFLNLIWIFFILFVGSTDMDGGHYISFSFAILYFMYIYNQIYPTKLSLKNVAIYLIIPSGLMWHIYYTYNWFLSLSPINKEALFITMLLYFYLIIYIISEFDD